MNQESKDNVSEIDRQKFLEKMDEMFGDELIKNPQLFFEGFIIMLAMIFVKNRIPKKRSMMNIVESFVVAYDVFEAFKEEEENGGTLH